MEKTNFTFVRPLRWMLMPLLLLVGYGVSAQSLTCNNNVQVSVNDTPNACEIEITADMILESPDDMASYTLDVVDGVTPVASGPAPLTIQNVQPYFSDILTVTVTDDATGNSCWGSITIEDKLAPVIECQPLSVDCDVALPPVYNNAGPTDQYASTGVRATDNCDSDPTIELTDEVALGDICTGSSTVTRTYVSFDAWGNQSGTCDVVITINRVTPVFPADVEYECTTYAANNGIIAPTAAGAGHPFGTGDFEACNYAVSHSDQVLPTCGYDASTDEPVFKIVRTWTVLDWCTSTVITMNGTGDNIQVIKVIDTVGPDISMGEITVQASTPGQHPHPCTSQELIPAPGVLSDLCTGVDGLQIFTPVGEAVYLGGNPFNGGFIPAPGLEVGQYTITYVATDGCGNISEFNASLVVVDEIAPVAICDEITDVNLSSDGYAVVGAGTFDDGSHDNCCIDYFEVRRMEDNCGIAGNTAFGPSVTFCCEDIDDNPHTVVFRAWDCYGNYNDCMVDVYVQDKIDPWVSCPPNAEITCDEYWDDLEADISLCNGDSDCISQVLTDAGFGTYTAWDNCEYIVSVSVSVNLDQCGEGSITRTFSVEDPSGNTGAPCTQTILVHHVSDFVVEFPADITAVCVAGDDAPDFGEPEIFFESCELVAVSYEDTQFDVVVDACYKIVRDWTVINWCVIGDDIDQEPNAVEDPENALGLPFPLCDLDGDGDCDDRTFRDSWSNGSYPDASNATDQFGPDSDSDSDPWDGYIVYQQVIKVIDNVAPVFPDGCAIDDVCIWDGCATSVTLPSFGADDCSDDVTTIVESTTLPNGSGFGPYTNVAPGTYEVIYAAFDNCGNSTACASTVTVVDCKNPTPYCVEGLVITLMNTDPPMVDVWAVDFDAGSFDNCGVKAISFSEDITDTQRIYDCDDIGNNTIQLWVTDIYDNQDFCETFVIVDPGTNIDLCDFGDDLVQTAGAISNEVEAPVEDVTVELSGQSNGMVTTDEAGNFSFNVPAGNDITITPSKDDNPLNGVTTFDIVLISKHILGTQDLDSPYKMIAADANNSNSITTIDIVNIRKLILQIDDNFTNNSSWRFVDKDFTFTNPSNPWATSFPEVININNIDTDELAANFVAIKVGDVNMSAATSNLLGADDRNTVGTFALNAQDRMLSAGEVVSVDFTASQEVQGYQFTMNFNNKVDFVELTSGVAQEENFGFALLNERAITASWNGAGIADQTVFTLTFVANADVMLSEALNINSRYTVAEAYNNNGELMDVELNFNNSGAATFELYQNSPNPFNGETTIGFNLPQAGAATLTIADVSGKVLKVVEGDFAKGYNQVRVNNIPSTGVLYYTLETATETATKKMVSTK